MAGASFDGVLSMTIRVMHVGLGPIGAAVARQVASRKGFQIVGAVDIDPHKVGRDVGDVIELGRKAARQGDARHRQDDQGHASPTSPCCAPARRSRTCVPQFEEVLKRRVPIVTTTEEAAYPAPHNRRLAKRLDEAARKAKVAVLGTGVNPGFTMDALPIALTAVCERVDRVEVQRVQDARIRRLPFQQKIGAGLTREQFRRKVDEGTVRHVGFHRVDSDDRRRAGLEARSHHRRHQAEDRRQARWRASCWPSMPATCAGIIQDGVGLRERRAAHHAATRGVSRRAGVVRLGAHRGVAADPLAESTAACTATSPPRRWP